MSAAHARKRRSPGEGSVWEYKERNGTVRYAVGHPSFGTRRRGPNGEKWFTKKAARRRSARSWSTPPAASWSSRASRSSAPTARRSSTGCGSSRRRGRPTSRTGADARRALPARRRAARAADRHEADRPLPGAGEVRPQGPQGRGGPVGADGPLHPHDHPRRPRPGGEGRPAAAQPRRRGHAADRPRGEGAGDDLLVRQPSSPPSWAGPSGTARITPCGARSPTPACAAAKRCRCAGGTSTRTRPRPGSAGRRASSASQARARR